MPLRAIMKTTFPTSKKKTNVSVSESTRKEEAERIIVMRFLRICTIGFIVMERQSDMLSPLPG